MLKLSKIRKNEYLRFIFVVIPSYMRYNYYKFSDRSRSFKFQGQDYKYFNLWYNTTWNDERAVEIPIICRFIHENNNDNILEIGNVLSHYFNLNHDIVDKYEKSDGVINEDVVNFQTTKNYKLIVSISTLEHVGWDETPRDPTKIFDAIDNLMKGAAGTAVQCMNLMLGFEETLGLEFSGLHPI